MRVLFLLVSAAVFLQLLLNQTTAVVGAPRFLLRSRLGYSSYCDKVSFTQNDYTFRGQDLFQCNILPTTSQSTIRLLPSSTNGCSYKLIAYSGQNCNDDMKVNIFNFNSGQASITLNKGKSVCSYKLGNSPQRGRTVLVKFGRGNYEMISNEHGQRGCYNLCSSRHQTFFPEWAGVYGRGGNIDRDNFIELFSEPRCADESLIRFRNGRTNIQFERLEEIGNGQTIGSFKFVRERYYGKSLKISKV